MPFIELKSLRSKEVVPGYTARTIHTGTMTLVYWTVKKDAAIPQHEHLHEQVAHVLQGQFELTVDGETRVLSPGHCCCYSAPRTAWRQCDNRLRTA